MSALIGKSPAPDSGERHRPAQDAGNAVANWQSEDSAEGEYWAERLSNSRILEALSREVLEQLAEEAELVVLKAGRYKQQENNDAFKEWLMNTLLECAGAAHRWSNQAGALPMPLQEVLHDWQWRLEPQQVIIWREAHWAAMWQWVYQQKLSERFCRLERLALEEQSGEHWRWVTLERLDAALAQFKASTSSCSYD